MDTAYYHSQFPSCHSQIFDFGLCKSLSSDLKAPSGGYGYRLTGRAGSLPYMAPEVRMYERREERSLHEKVAWTVCWF